ncbi:cytochrome c3 family protein, partial [bacterium]|nr:cytochrome c3 family protein [bacterium]MBU1025355.1 cytochrome c3 family protein [bacterium]
MNTYGIINCKTALITILVFLGTISVAIPALRLAHENLTCWDCHLEEDILGPPVRPCLDCHSSEGSHVEGFNPPSIDFLHEQAPEAPTCVACHGNHDIESPNSPDSPVYWRNTPDLCGSCHMKAEFEGVIK